MPTWCETATPEELWLDKRMFRCGALSVREWGQENASGPCTLWLVRDFRAYPLVWTGKYFQSIWFSPLPGTKSSAKLGGVYTDRYISELNARVALETKSSWGGRRLGSGRKADPNSLRQRAKLESVSLSTLWRREHGLL